MPEILGEVMMEPCSAQAQIHKELEKLANVWLSLGNDTI